MGMLLSPYFDRQRRVMKRRDEDLRSQLALLIQFREVDLQCGQPPHWWSLVHQRRNTFSD